MSAEFFDLDKSAIGPPCADRLGSVLITQSSALSSYDFVRPRQHTRRNRQADLLGGLQ